MKKRLPISKKQTGEEHLHQRAVVRILFGPPPDKEWPPEVKKEFQDARGAVSHLVGQIYNGPHKKELVDRLIELGSVVCSHLEHLWGNHDYRSFVEDSSRRRNYFPLLHTNLIETRYSCSDEMREKLPLQLAPGNEKGKKGKGKPGRKVLDDLLNREVEMFVLAVLKPGTLRVENLPAEPDSIVPFINRVEVDVIDNATRQYIVSPIGRKRLGVWSQAFTEKYIRPYRPDLLSEDGQAGTFQKMVADRLSELQAKNPDEKSPWRAFKTLVTERLRKFKPLIESAILPN
ncbi:MAG TPA: hypothetical protein VNV15_03980 [Opitutaceae bacterium]|nr:hypothetical protein [Opitutaceae bacterium]